MIPISPADGEIASVTPDKAPYRGKGRSNRACAIPALAAVIWLSNRRPSVDGNSGAACFGRIHIMSPTFASGWFDAAKARGITLDDTILLFTIRVVRDLPSLDLTSALASLLEAVAADDSVASGV